MEPWVKQAFLESRGWGASRSRASSAAPHRARPLQAIPPTPRLRKP